MKEVAGYLGNTPAVARRSYVDPRVVDLYLDGVAVNLATIDRSVGGSGLAIHGPLEKAVIALLRESRRKSRDSTFAAGLIGGGGLAGLGGVELTAGRLLIR